MANQNTIKFLDEEGLSYLLEKLNNYPNNDILDNVINAIHTQINTSKPIIVEASKIVDENENIILTTSQPISFYLSLMNNKQIYFLQADWDSNNHYLVNVYIDGIKSSNQGIYTILAHTNILIANNNIKTIYLFGFGLSSDNLILTTSDDPNYLKTN